MATMPVGSTLLTLRERSWYLRMSLKVRDRESTRWRLQEELENECMTGFITGKWLQKVRIHGVSPHEGWGMLQ